MHRKRVTCELHDSYFRLMASKHAIPKIECAIKLLYNSVNTGSQGVGDQVSWRWCSRESHHPAEGAFETPDRVGDQTSWRQDVVGKATTLQKGPSGPPMEFADQLVRRCWNKNMSQRRTRTTHGDVRRGWGGQYVAVFVQSPTPSHSKTLSNLTIKWEVYFFKRSLRSSLFIASICILHVYVYICICICRCICMWVYNTWKCPWCNGYRPKKWTRRHEFNSWARLIAFSHSTNTNKTCRTRLEKLRRTHQRRSLVDPFTRMSRCWTTSLNISTTALYRYRM